MFKDKYKKDNDLIKPDPELIKRIDEKMSNANNFYEYSKIRRKRQLTYGLVVACFFIVIIPMLLFGSKNNNDNVFDNIENNYINNDTKASENTKIPEDQIYAYYTSMNSWAVDPENTEELIVDSAAVVKIKVISIGRANFFLSNYFKPLTPINVEIVEVLSGENLSDKITIHTEGGEVLIADMIKHLPEQSMEKRGLTKLDPEKQNNTYVSYTSEYDYDFEIGNEYVVILYKQVNGLYTVIANGYGIFKQENQIYKNVITGKSFDFEE